MIEEVEEGDLGGLEEVGGVGEEEGGLEVEVGSVVVEGVVVEGVVLGVDESGKVGEGTG